MATRVSVTDADLSIAEHTAATNNSNAPSPAQPFIRGPRASHAVTFADGHVQHVSRGVERSTPRPNDLQPGYVRLANGTTTTYDAARAAGLLGTIVEHSDADHRWGRLPPEDGRATHRLSTDEEDNSQSAQEQREPAEAGAQLNVTAEDKATIEAGASALKSVNTALGSETVSAAIDDVVVSGELPTELPSGASTEQVNAIVAGLTAQANAVLSDTGVTINLLNEMLDGNDLREARRAVYLNDDQTLRELGAKAMRRLERLPENPADFKALTADFGPKVEVHRTNGETWVTTPNWNMSWFEAVRTGRIKF